MEAIASRSAAFPSLLSDLSTGAIVQVEDGLAAVSLIGRSIEENCGLFAHAVGARAKCSVPFHAAGRTPLRISFVVAAQELQVAAAALHDSLVKFREARMFWSQAKTLGNASVLRTRFSVDAPPGAS